MRTIYIAVAVALIGLPAWAQTQQQRGWCADATADNDQRVAGCTALIQSGKETSASLAEAYINRGVVYGGEDRLDEAIADFTQAIAVKPDAAGGYMSRALAYHLANRDAEGLPDAEKAVALLPGPALYIETRAEIYEALGRRDEAVVGYRTALRIDPNNQQAKEGLARLGATP